MRISGWSSDGCSSDLGCDDAAGQVERVVPVEVVDLLAQQRGIEAGRRGGGHQTLGRASAARWSTPCSHDPVTARTPSMLTRLRNVGGSFGWWAKRTLYGRSEEHTSELLSLMRISYAVFCLKKKINRHQT